jgi:hypothetical protein
MKRILCTFLTACATASLAAAPALATDEPGPGTLQPAPPIPAVQQVLNKCQDLTRPTSGFGATSARAAARTHVLRGTARDTGCGVAMVTLSVARLHGKRCEYLTSRRKLSRAVKCGHSHFLVASGTNHWSLALPRSLPRGTYLVRTRAIDFAGNVQRLATGRHIHRLRLR